MICNQAIIPCDDACGFVIPVFYENQNDPSFYFCQTDSNNKIISFVKQHSSYKPLSCTKQFGPREYFIGSVVPYAFYFRNNETHVLLIGSEDEIKKYLISALQDAIWDAGVEAKYKALLFVGHDNLPEHVVKCVYVQYYNYLSTLDEEYANEWRLEVQRVNPKIGSFFFPEVTYIEPPYLRIDEQLRTRELIQVIIPRENALSAFSFPSSFFLKQCASAFFSKQKPARTISGFLKPCYKYSIQSISSKEKGPITCMSNTIIHTQYARAYSQSDKQLLPRFAKSGKKISSISYVFFLSPKYSYIFNENVEKKTITKMHFDNNRLLYRKAICYFLGEDL